MVESGMGTWELISVRILWPRLSQGVFVQPVEKCDWDLCWRCVEGHLDWLVMFLKCWNFALDRLSARDAPVEVHLVI